MKDITRREFIISTAALASVAALKPLEAKASSDPVNPFSLSSLGYEYSALEPFIDSQTMVIHHTKHHQAYVDKLNAAVAKNSLLRNLSLEELLKKSASLGDAIKNNAGGHYNHTLFWKLMDPVGRNSGPSKKLLEKINQQFGSLDHLKEELNSVALSHFGSGWAWLYLNANQKLGITSTANQDNLLIDGIGVDAAQTLIGIDVWEHAYYLKYQNNRSDYLKKWWEVINWKEVNARFDLNSL